MKIAFTMARALVGWHREIYADSSIGAEHPEDCFDKRLAKIAADNIWVALRGSRTVGFVGLSIEGNEAEVERLIVAKSCRNEGIGSQLIQTVVSEARKREIPFLNVKPVARNEKAIKFLSKQGFTILGHLDVPWTFLVSLGSPVSRFMEANSRASFEF